MRSRPTSSLAPAAVLAAVALAGCGSSGSEDADPAELAPADSPAYFEARIDPEGAQEEAVDALVQRFPGAGDPGEEIADLLDQAFTENDLELTYSEDVEPWLGDRAGGFVSGFSEDQGDGAAVLATTDEDAASDALEKALPGAEERSYEDADYLFNAEEETAAGIVEGFLVIGTEGGLRAAVDASGAESLAESDRFSSATEDLPEDRLASYYVDYSSFGALAAEDSGLVGPERQVVESLFGLAGSEPVVASVRAEPDAVVLDSSISGLPTLFAGLGLGGGTPLLDALPADSWLALGQPDVGEALGGVLDAIGEVPGLDPEVIAGQLRAETGLELERDVIGWIGDLAIFVRGSSMADLGGGVVIETLDPDSSARALNALGRLARSEGVTVARPSARGVEEGFSLEDPSIPEPVNLVQAGSSVVIAYGDAATEAALDPEATLGDDAAFTAAVEGLGEGYAPSSYVAVAPILTLAEGLGASEDPDYAEARPYLEQLSHLVAGAREDGEALQSRTRLELE